jgi:hypothetical protein
LLLTAAAIFLAPVIGGVFKVWIIYRQQRPGCRSHSASLS